MPNKLRDDLHKVDDTSFDYIYEENATIQLKNGRGIVRCNVFRPKASKDAKFPVLATYGPCQYLPSQKTVTSAHESFDLTLFSDTAF